MPYDKPIFGMSGTTDWDSPDFRPLSYREAAFKLVPESPSPFTFILSKLPSSTVTDPVFKIFEERLPVQAAKVEADVAPEATQYAISTINFQATADVPEPAYAFKVGDLLKVEGDNAGVVGSPREVVRIETIESGTQITAMRYWGAGAQTNLPIMASTIMRWVGSAYPEGDTAPRALSKRSKVVTNFTEIFKDTAGLSGTASATTFRPEKKQWPVLKMDALERHMIKLEEAFLHGVADEVPVQNARGEIEMARTTAGVRTIVMEAGYYHDFQGALTIDVLEDRMQRVFTYGSKEKLGLTGYGALNYLNKLVRANTNWNWNAEAIPKKQTFGLDVFKIRSPFGTLNLVPHPLMAESEQYTNELYIVDMKYAEYVSLSGRDTKWKDNAAYNDEDAKRGFFLTEAGLRLALPECHEVWLNMNGLG